MVDLREQDRKEREDIASLNDAPRMLFPAPVPAL